MEKVNVSFASFNGCNVSCVSYYSNDLPSEASQPVVCRSTFCLPFKSDTFSFKVPLLLFPHVQATSKFFEFFFFSYFFSRVTLAPFLEVSYTVPACLFTHTLQSIYQNSLPFKSFMLAHTFLMHILPLHSCNKLSSTKPTFMLLHILFVTLKVFSSLRRAEGGEFSGTCS